MSSAHAHVHDDDHDDGEDDHHHRVTSNSEYDFDHLLAHALKGDVDLGSWDQVSGHADLPQAVPMSLVVFCLIERSNDAAQSQIRHHRPTLRPPATRSAFYLMPPANAPPPAA